MRGKITMIFNGLKKVISLSLVASVLLNPTHLMAQENSGGVLDDSINDLYIVLGTGAAGAIIGLSTLSFADKPKDKLKNISIGAAIGIVLGVGVALTGIASKSKSSIGYTSDALPLSAEEVEKLDRLEFADQKVAQDYYRPAQLGYNWSF